LSIGRKTALDHAITQGVQIGQVPPHLLTENLGLLGGKQ
jgi:hypothetical protein